MGVFKVKYHLDRSVERFKVWLVVQGYSQVYGIDYAETFAFTNSRESLRIILVTATILEMIILQMDVINAYLETAFSQNDQPIYMKIL